MNRKLPRNHKLTGNRKPARDPGISQLLFFSVLFHLLVFALIFEFGRFNTYKPATPTYYVELANLPVAKPRSGTPSRPEKTIETLSSTSKQEMSIPVQHREKAVKPEPVPHKQKVEKPVRVQKTEVTEKLKRVQRPKKVEKPVEPTPPKKTLQVAKPGETEEDFLKRISNIENKVDSQHEQSALTALKRSLKTNTRAGIPGGSGVQAGSDYASYIQSRLRDAFRATIAYQSSNPEVEIRLRINRFGKIIGYSMEKSTHDKLFEASVVRAIQIAGEKFPPPPDNSTFDHGYIFMPEGVGKK